MGQTVLPASFDVELTPTTMTLGRLSGAVLVWSDKGDLLSVFGRLDGANVQVLFDWTTGKGTWTFNGLQGNASGKVTLSR